MIRVLFNSYIHHSERNLHKIQSWSLFTAIAQEVINTIHNTWLHSEFASLSMSNATEKAQLHHLKKLVWKLFTIWDDLTTPPNMRLHKIHSWGLFTATAQEVINMSHITLLHSELASRNMSNATEKAPLHYLKELVWNYSLYGMTLLHQPIWTCTRYRVEVSSLQQPRKLLICLITLLHSEFASVSMSNATEKAQLHQLKELVWKLFTIWDDLTTPTNMNLHKIQSWGLFTATAQEVINMSHYFITFRICLSQYVQCNREGTITPTQRTCLEAIHYMGRPYYTTQYTQLRSLHCNSPGSY